MKKFLLFNTNKISEAVEPRIFKFPGGEVSVDISSFMPVPENVRIFAYIKTSDDVMVLVMLVDALREAGARHIRLTLPYLPYARQDRVCNRGEAFSLRAFGSIINSLGFSSVVCVDVHSDVAYKYINNLVVSERKHHILDYLNKIDGTVYLVSPDKGAIKKTEDTANISTKVKGVVYADKQRDLATGKIIRFGIIGELPEDAKDATFVVADDICDGGGTFIGLSSELRDKVGKLNLYVTHGIFSKGREVLENAFDDVYAQYDWSQE